MSMFKFKAVKFAQFLSGIYILVVTFTELGKLGSFGGTRDPESGFIIDPTSEENTKNGVILWNGDLRAVVANSIPQMILLGISRFSGFFMYPALILCFLTKLRATGTFLASTMCNMFLYQDMHRLHVYCGWVILLDSCVHTTCHITRWMLQGNYHLLYCHNSGITGLIVIGSTFLICLPMIVWKDKIKYEIRKLTHYLFIVFGIAMCFHAPPSAAPNGGFCAYVFPVLLIWYFLDTLYCSCVMTELIETTIYETLPSGVQMSMAVSKRFQNCRANGGYAYVCFPWVDRTQWHAFSLFENPNNPEERQVFMQKCGDWTTQVHEQLQRDSVRPVYIQGPFPSPYKNAIQYDNQILVAAGIGITPALSVIRAHKVYRRINLVWTVRDPAMVEFFLSHAYLDNRGWNLIFYTGKEPLSSSLMDGLKDSNVCIVQSRPTIQSLIPNIIYGFESGEDKKKKDRSSCSSLDAAKSGSFARRQTWKHIMDTIRSPIEAYEQNGGEQHQSGDYECSFDDLEQGRRTPEDFEDERYGSHSRSSSMSHTVDGNRSRAPSIACTVATVGSRSECGQPDSSYPPIVPKDKRPAKVLTKDETKTYMPWDPNPKSMAYVQGLDPQCVKATWGVLYCGGKNKLLEGLKEVTKELGIKLHEESFNW